MTLAIDDPQDIHLATPAGHTERPIRLGWTLSLVVGASGVLWAGIGLGLRGLVAVLPL